VAFSGDREHNVTQTQMGKGESMATQVITIEITDREIEALQSLIIAEDKQGGFAKVDAEHRRTVVEKILMETGDFLTEYYEYFK
jgi:hypothetical protein